MELYSSLRGLIGVDGDPGRFNRAVREGIKKVTCGLRAVTFRIFVANIFENRAPRYEMPGRSAVVPAVVAGFSCLAVDYATFGPWGGWRASIWAVALASALRSLTEEYRLVGVHMAPPLHVSSCVLCLKLRLARKAFHLG